MGNRRLIQADGDCYNSSLDKIMNKPEPEFYSIKYEKKIPHNHFDVSIDMSDDEDSFDCHRKSAQVRLEENGDVFISIQNGHTSTLETRTLTFSDFCDSVKEIMEKPSIPLILANPEQLKILQQLIELLKIDQEAQQKWLTKCNCDSLEEMTFEQIESCIQAQNKKILELNSKNGGKK